MRYFWDSLEEYGNRVALVSEQETVSYAQLSHIADAIAQDVPERSFAFLVCSNQIASIAGYFAFLRKRVAVVLLHVSIDRAFIENLTRVYQPQFIWCPEEFPQLLEGATIGSFGGYQLISTGSDRPEMNENLAALITTSGSTGSPKFVRLSYGNIQANTESIVKFLGIGPNDRAITTLPMSYAYGLSIVQSHLMSGAGVIATEKTVFDGKFWTLFRKYGATTFATVPYSCHALDALHFSSMDLPSLRYITHAGGRLDTDLHVRMAKGMHEKGKHFVAMYGASEATARMGYVPHKVSVEKAGYIGIAIPGGRFELIDDSGAIISAADTMGELVYHGANVMLGYACCRQDLAKGDELHGCLKTGDLAKRDNDGFYYVVGRKSRFLKVYGNRVSLEEIEGLLSENGYEAVCAGEDDHLRIYTTSTQCERIVALISRKTGLNAQAFSAVTIQAIPRNEAGKILYAELP